MGKEKKYSTANSFRTALEERLKNIHQKEQTGIQALRKLVSFDRLLARLFSGDSPSWVLKGGYAMELRISNARATKDVDVAMKELKMESTNQEEQGDALLEVLQEHTAKDLGDFFEFIITGPILDLDAPPYGGGRLHVEARIDGRSFEKFHLDIGIGDVWMEPFDQLTSRGWLEFAGFPTQNFPSLSKEQQFAEKIHAYTLPRDGGRPNSRVKDLIDMALLMPSLDDDRVVESVKATFKRRATHDFTMVSPPPPSWEVPFKAMAEECKISATLESAFSDLEKFIKKLPL